MNHFFPFKQKFETGHSGGEVRGRVFINVAARDYILVSPFCLAVQ